MTETAAWVATWFAEKKGYTAGAPADRLATDYFQAGLIDSFGVMELIADVEERFAIRFDDTHFQDRRFPTLGGLAAIIDEARGGLPA